MLALVVTFKVLLLAKLIDDISLDFGLCLKHSGVEDRAVSAVSNIDSIIRAIKCIKQHRRKHDTEKSGGLNTSLLNPICDGKGCGAFFIVLRSCMHAVMKLSNDGDEFFGAAVFYHDSPKDVSVDHVKCLGQINKKSNRGQCSVLDIFLVTVLQQTPCQQSHVPYGSCIDSPVRNHVVVEAIQKDSGKDFARN